MSDTLPDFGDFSFDSEGSDSNVVISGRSDLHSPSSDPADSPPDMIEDAESAAAWFAAREARENKQVQVTDVKFATGKWPEWSDPEEFTTVISATYTAYTALQRIPFYTEVAHVLSMPAGRIQKFFATQEFIDAVQARGIPWNNFHGLTAEQMLVAQLVTNPVDKRELKAKLKSAGVTYPQYRAWMRQPAFSRYMQTITEGMLSDHLPDFNTVLTKKALAGDLHSIKYINELSGRHDPNRQVVLDLQAIVQNLLDIITRNVRDPEVIQQISAEFSLAVNAKQSLRGEITSGPNT